MEIVIEKVIGLAIVILGISYFLQARVWAAVSRDMFERPSQALFLTTLFLPVGLLMVIGHNLWVRDFRVVVTILGWLITLKCVIYLVAPNWAAKLGKGFSDEFVASAIRISGGVMLGIGAAIVYLVYN